MAKTIDPRLQTTDHRLQTRLQSAVCILAVLALFPVTGYAATQTSDSGVGASSEPSTPLSRAIEAGKATSKRALSSKAKEAGEEAVPVATVTSSIVGKAAATPASVTDETAAKGVEAVPAKAVPNAQKRLRDMGGAKVPSEVSPDKKGKYVFEYPDQPVIDEKMEPVTKKIVGEVGVVIKMGMNVEFGRNDKAATSSDLWINFAKGVKLEGVKAFGDFRDGDKVQVSYAESKDGSKRVIESIKMLKAKTDEERKREALAAEAEALAGAKKEKNVDLGDES